MSARIYNIPGELPRFYYAAFDLVLDGTERTATPTAVIPRGEPVRVIHERWIGQDMIDVDVVYHHKLYTISAPFLSKTPVQH